ncbi:MAG: ATP synthase subunit I [Bryobacteraceae bacterium]|nr:ATP synthase subunit I [Bryobacteraceae bacterium]
MPEIDERKALRKIWLLLAGLSVAGAAGFLFRGRHAAISFLAGTGISALSFWLLQRATRILTRAAAGEILKAPSAITHVLRYALVFALVYVMLSVYGVDRTAFVCGLLTAVTAAVLDALIESVYA